MDIRAARRLAYGVQAPLAQFRLQQMNRFEMRAALSEPFWQPSLRGEAIYLDKRIKSHENSSSHAVYVWLRLSQLTRDQHRNALEPN